MMGSALKGTQPLLQRKWTLAAGILGYSAVVTLHFLQVGDQDVRRTVTDLVQVLASAAFIAAGSAQIARSHRIGNQRTRLFGAVFFGAVLMVVGILTFPLTGLTALIQEAEPLVLGLAAAVICLGGSCVLIVHGLRSTNEQLPGDAESLPVADGERGEELVHDVTNVINALRMASTVMSNPGDHCSRVEREQLGTAMLGEIDHLEQLITPRENPTLVDFDVEQAIRPVIEMQRINGMTIKLIPSGIWARGSSADLATVVRNLLINARLHAPGSEVTIRAGMSSLGVQIFVEDSGPGIPSKHHDHVFARGVARVESPGSGLGLYVSRTLMREQGGDIAIQDHPRRGTTFMLSLQTASRFRTPRGPQLHRRSVNSDQWEAPKSLTGRTR